METNEIKSASLKKAFKTGIVNNVSVVRVNATGYKFVTVLDSKSKASNIYLGRKSSEQVAEGQAIPTDVLKRSEFVLAENEAGEARVKLSLTGASGFQSLGDMFDDEITATEREVLTALAQSMTAKDEVPQNDEHAHA